MCSAMPHLSSRTIAELMDTAARVATVGGTVAKRRFRDDALTTERKVDDSPVTEADRGAERVMRAAITRRFPDHAILGEEYGGEIPAHGFVWVLDPIDGTRAFICGLPTWGTLIGLTSAGYPVLGMMDQPYIGERFVGDGRRAWRQRNGVDVPLTTRACTTLGAAIFCTTHPSLFTGAQRTVYDDIEASVRTPRFGTDCYGYAMLASGHVDLVIEPGLQPYDIAALIPVIEGAGGVVTTWTGGSAAQGGNVVASGDPRLHDLALERLAHA